MFNKLWCLNILEDIQYIIITFLKGQPLITDGVYILSSSNVEELKQDISTKHLIGRNYDIIPSELLTSCEFKIRTNNIYIYSHDSKNEFFKFCESKLNNNEFYTTYLPFYIKWFSGAPLNFGFFGNYINFSNEEIQNKMHNLPIGSTLVFTFAENIGFRKVNDELFSRSHGASLYENNPYYRSLKNIFLNLNNNHIYIKLPKEIKGFSSSIEELSDFSIKGIKTWQQVQIKNFIKFFLDEVSKNIKGKSEVEFHGFIKNHLFDEKSIGIFQEDIPRSRELLLFNLINANDIKKIGAILKSDIDVNCKLKGEITALHLASTLGLEDVVRLLIEHNANTEATTINKITPLAISAEQNFGVIVSLLLDSGVDPNIKDSYGLTPLFFAIEKNATSTITMLLDSGASLNYADNYGNTPFTLALEKGDISIAKLLLSYAPNLQSEEYISWKKNYEYKNEIYNEIVKFETNYIKYILESHHYTTSAIKALYNLKFFINKENIIVHISKVQDCLYELKTDELYNNHVEICYDNNVYANNYSMIQSTENIDISFLGLNE